MKGGKSARRGATTVEFAIVLMLLLTVILAGLEIDRLLLVYTTVANSARVGARYAIVHGSSRSAGVGDPASGATDTTKVEEVVKAFARIGTLDPDKVAVEVKYPASTPLVAGNEPGNAVVVTVKYPYDPLTFLPFTIDLATTTRGVIVF
jgi:Flp pilus assembly protein TadG